MCKQFASLNAPITKAQNKHSSALFSRLGTNFSPLIYHFSHHHDDHKKDMLKIERLLKCVYVRVERAFDCEVPVRKSEWKKRKVWGDGCQEMNHDKHIEGVHDEARAREKSP